MNFKFALKLLKDIFPFFLSALLIIPSLISFFINIELVDKFSLFIKMLWLPVFTILYGLTRSKIIYKLTVILFFIIGILEITHWLIMKGPMTITSLLVISNTNFEETIDFLNLKGSFSLILLVPYTYVFIRALRPPNLLPKSSIKNLFNISYLAVIGLFIIFLSQKKMLLIKGVPQFIRISHSFYKELQIHNNAIENATLKLVDATYNSNEKENTIVLILGESLSANHMSLYNYKKNTNPKLSARNDILVYKSVVSGYSSSINNILSIFSNSNLQNEIKFDETVDIFDIVASTGYTTYWISNQSPIGLYDNVITALGKKSTTNLFVNTSSNSSMESFTKRSYDNKLFKPFQKILREKKSKKFIVVHLMGNHNSYKKRYPSSYENFKGKSTDEKLIAAYDNSVLYNDFIVDSLLNILVQDHLINNTNSSAIYLSDHGENIFDEFNDIGHDYTTFLPKANVEIPFFLWLAPNNSQISIEKLAVIKNNLNKPYVSDDLFHSLIDLSQIKSPYYEPKRSIFNAAFTATRRRILVDGNDYDKPYKIEFK